MYQIDQIKEAVVNGNVDWSACKGKTLPSPGHRNANLSR